MVKSCYIHIPFCDSICSYCDFCKLLRNDAFIDSYLDALEKEIQEYYQGEELTTLYIGGGTPSCLSLSQLKRLFEILSVFHFSKNVEYTIEGNFESTTKEKLELYRKVGINRLSFGVETIHPKQLEFLQRKLDLEQVREKIQFARKIGFSNINVDLMYALPKETLKDLEEDLQFILSLKVEHISTYSLMIEKNTLLDIWHTQSMDEDMDFSMYQMICNTLEKHSYHHYEISNFAKEGYESCHNQTYWKNDEYYGFGLGASSYIENQRIENTRSLQQYLKGSYRKKIDALEKKDLIEYEILLRLRMKEGIDLISFQKRYGKELKEYYSYDELVENGFLKEENNQLFIPEDKWYISNEIIVKVLEGEIDE